jgi:transposase-like protein
MAERRKQWTGEEIMGVIRRVLVDREELSKVCEEMDCHPSQFYRWQKQLLDGGVSIFSRKAGPTRELENARRRGEELSQKLRRKDEVLAELMEEHVRLKKKTGEGCEGSGSSTKSGTTSWIS